VTNFSGVKFIICNKNGALLLSSSHLQIVGVLRYRTDTQLLTFFCCVHHRTIDEEALEQALSAAVTCTILAAAGPQRSRVLATLYKVNNLSVCSKEIDLHYTSGRYTDVWTWSRTNDARS
jgi:hypothetical protein